MPIRTIKEIENIHMPVEIIKENTLIVPSEIIGKAVERFYERVDNYIKGSGREVVLDCSRLDHATSSNIYILWRSILRFREARIETLLVKVSSNLERILKVLDLYELMVIDRTGEKTAPAPKVAVNLDGADHGIILEFKPDDGAIVKRRHEFRGFLKKINLPEILIFELETVFYEVASNIRQHSHIGKENAIRFSATPSSEKIRMEFVYPGIKFDPKKNLPDFHPETAIKSQQKRGYGLMLINRMMDNLKYEHRDNTVNVLTLEKKWR
nr:ATP-binding protein [candidate division Zixibacteria bacterium]